MEATTRTPITVSTMVNAPVEKVWQCWNGPDHITKWCQATPEWHAPSADNDLRKGGKFRTTMAAKDGSMSFEFEGVYDEVEPMKRIAYTMADGRRVKIVFEQEGQQTRITETFDPESQNSIELQRGGWQAILDSFKQYTESQP